MLSFSGLYAPIQKALYVERATVIQPYEKIIHAVVTVESNGDVYAFNKREKAYGAFQIREVRLKDYNAKTGSKYVLTDMYDYNISKKVFMYYASQYDPSDIKGICISWNGKSKKNKYYYKVKKQML